MTERARLELKITDERRAKLLTVCDRYLQKSPYYISTFFESDVRGLLTDVATLLSQLEIEYAYIQSLEEALQNVGQSMAIRGYNKEG